jgi:hypothetical protein
MGVILLAAAIALGKNGPSASNFQFAVDSSGTGPPPKTNPGQACKGLSRKHVKGEGGTPYSRCVTETAKSNGR